MTLDLALVSIVVTPKVYSTKEKVDKMAILKLKIFAL